MSTLKLEEVTDYDDLTERQKKAFFTMCGGLQVVKEVLMGHMKIIKEVGGGRVTIEDVIRRLLDKNGRCIPTADKTVVTAAVCDPNTSYQFGLVLPAFGLEAVPKNWEELFGQRLTVSPEECKLRITALLERIRADQRTENLLKGPWYPVLLPRISEGDYGTVLETELLPAVKRGYEAAFPERQFINYLQGELNEQVTIVDDRHKQLIKDMQSEQLVGIICYPLQGFSLDAQRQMATLMPDYFSLLGAMDSAVAEALYPHKLSRDGKTVVRDCSAVQWRGPVTALCFDACDVKLEFSDGYRLARAFGDCSGGFLVRG